MKDKEEEFDRLMSKGRTYLNLNKPKKALNYFSEASQKNPQSFDAYLNLGAVYYGLNEHEKAKDALLVAFFKKPTELWMHANIGCSLHNLGNFVGALNSYEIALKYDWTKDQNGNSKKATIYYDKGTTLSALGRDEEAVNAFKQSINSDPTKIESYNNLGYVLNKKYKYQEGYDILLKALQLKENHPLLLYNLGNSKAGLGYEEEACKYYEKSFELKPQNAEACYNIGLFLIKKGKKEKALAAYEEAIKLNPGYADQAFKQYFQVDLMAEEITGDQ